MDKNNTNTNTRNIKTPSRLNYENLLTSSKNAGEVTPKHKRRGRPRILKDYMNPMKSPMANTSLKVQKLGYNEMKPVMKVAHSSPSNSSTISSANNNNSNSSSSNNTTPSFTPGTTHSNNNSNRASIATSSPFNSLINDRSPNNLESPDNNNNNDDNSSSNNHVNISSEKKRNKYQNSISQIEMNSPLGKKRGKFGGVILNNNKNSPNFTANRLSGKKTKKIRKNSITENKRSISNTVSSDISTDATCNTSLITSSNVPSVISDDSSAIISTPNVNKFAFSLKIDPSSGKAFIDSPNDTKNSTISLKGSYLNTVDNSKNVINTERKTGAKDNAASTTIEPLIETIPSNPETSSPTINKKRILSLLSKMKRKNNNVTSSDDQDTGTENTRDGHNNNNSNNTYNTIDSEKSPMFTKLILTPPPTAARYSPRSIKLDLLRQQQSWSASAKTTNILVDTTATTSNLSNTFSSGINSTATTTNNNSGVDSDDEYKKFINTSPVVYEQHQPLNMDSAKDLLSSPITNIIMRNINNAMTNSSINTAGNNITGSPIYFGRQHNTGSHKRNSSASSVFINNCVLNSPNALNTTMNSNSNNLYSNNFSTMLPPSSTNQHIRNYDENPNTINIIHNNNNNDSSNDDNNDNTNNNNNNPSSIYDLELLSSPKKSW